MKAEDMAFPVPITDCDHGASGISIQDYFAARAMEVILEAEAGADICDVDYEVVAEQAYLMADAMMGVRGNEQ